MPAPQATVLDGATLSDRAGKSWHRTAGWLDPEEVRALLAAGAGWLIRPCTGDPQWSDQPSEQALGRDILPCLLTRRAAERRARRRTVPTVIIAEHWQDADHHDLILFLETGPHPRVPR